MSTGDFTSSWEKNPLVMADIAIENGYLKWSYPLKMVIFHRKMRVYQRVLWIQPKKWGIQDGSSKTNCGYN